MKKKWKDIIAICFLLGLVFIFYYPEGNNPLYSRYMYISGSFERAVKLINPDYNSFYWNIDWEKLSPFHEMIACYSLILFRNNLSGAVTFVFFGLALSATILTFIANRLYFPVLSSFFISLFLLFDRTLFPVVRGLGLIRVLFLIPFTLILIYNLAKTQDRSRHWRKQLVPMVLVAISIAVMYTLGGHETVFSLVFLVGFSFLLILEGIFRYKREKRFLRAPTVFSAGGFILGATLILVIFTQLFFNIYDEQHRSSKLFFENITHRHFMKLARSDLVKEPQKAENNRYQLFRSTFIEGKYLAKYGSWHANTFLYPGEGFNGIVPLFLIPGFLIGLVKLTRDSILIFKPKPSEEISRPRRYFLIFNMVLLGLFLVIFYLSNDPKPSRYTFCIYSVFALSAIGYEKLAGKIKCTVERSLVPASKNKPLVNSNRRYSTIAVVSFLMLFFIFTIKRLKKNYHDLQTYISVFQNQIPSIAIGPALAEARSKYSSKTVFIIHPEARHPSVGMLLGFKIPENIRLISKNSSINIADWRDWNDWKNQLHEPKPSDSVFYIWNEKSKTFNIQSGEEISGQISFLTFNRGFYFS